jgi:hypothetical protein
MLFVGAMHEEFIKRKFDYSLIGNEKQMSWKRKIKITRNNKIIFEESNIKVKIDLE